MLPSAVAAERNLADTRTDIKSEFMIHSLNHLRPLAFFNGTERRAIHEFNRGQLGFSQIHDNGK